jgi:S1-C subfamily serine protease
MGDKRLYVRVRGKVTGPFGLPQLRALRDRGQFRRFHEISEDRQTWVAAASLTELFPAAAPARSSSPEQTVIEVVPAANAPAAGAPPGPPAAEQWFYVGSDGQKHGPVSREQLLGLGQRGILQGDTLVWSPGMPDWAPADAAVGLGRAAPAPLPARRTSLLAVVALVLALLWLGGVGSLAAIVCGVVALGQIRRSQGGVGGRGLALAGVLLGSLLLVLTPAAALLLWWETFFGPVKVQRLSGTATAEEITAAYKHRVYRIETPTSTGSGVLVANTRSRGLVATNLHVLDAKLEGSPEQKRSATELPKVRVHVKNPNQLNPKPARWAAFHRAFDLALLVIEVEADRPSALPILRKKGVLQGETAVALGNPLGLEFFTSTGAISSTSGEGGVIWMTCPISGGNSGGPLFLARKGKLVGINTLSLVHPTAQNLNGSVPAEEIVASLHLRQTDSWVWSPDLKETVLELVDMIPLEN